MDSRPDISLLEQLGRPTCLSITPAKVEIRYDFGSITLSDQHGQRRALELVELMKIKSVSIDTQCEYVPNLWVETLQLLAQCKHLETIELANVSPYHNMTAWMTALEQLILGNRGLRQLSVVGSCAIDSPGVFTAIAKHLALTTLVIKPMMADDLAFIIRKNRSVRHLTASCKELMHQRPRSDTHHRAQISAKKTIIAAIEKNWVLRDLTMGDPTLRNLVAGRRWSKTHGIVMRYAIPLLPRLSPYEILWVLDWIKPMSMRYSWRHDPSFDPHHGKKIALIEGLAASYRAIKG